MLKKGKNCKIRHKRTVKIKGEVSVGDNFLCEGYCEIENCVIGKNCFLGRDVMIKDCFIGDGVKICRSFIEGCTIGDGCTIGPYARVRGSSEIGKNVKVGNFVEIKNSRVGDGCKISHLAYVGDCRIGKNCNVGCGVVFVNYDGKNKYKTVVGDDCFIGSNVNVIAPVNIASGTYICAGTNLTEDTKENDFIIGRVKPVVKNERGMIKKTTE